MGTFTAKATRNASEQSQRALWFGEIEWDAARYCSAGKSNVPVRV